jgi:hypothetical protein
MIYRAINFRPVQVAPTELFPAFYQDRCIQKGLTGVSAALEFPRFRSFLLVEI